MTQASGSWEVIEAEHAAIIELSNQVRIAAEKPGSFDAVFAAYQAVVEKFEEHFENEERLMAQIGYPGRTMHRRHHEVLLIRLLSLGEHMKSTGSVDLAELRVPFQSLLDDAIEDDASFKEYLDTVSPVRSESGVKPR